MDTDLNKLAYDLRVAERGRLPVGYHQFLADVSMNFQMNRFYGWVGEAEMLAEMHAVAPSITSYADWKRAFLQLADSAWRRGHFLRGGYYARAAEFFMDAQDLDRVPARQLFLQAIDAAYGNGLFEKHSVPYQDGQVAVHLPAYRFVAPQAKCTIVFFGGFDSDIEELMPAFLHWRNAGYEVIAFEGPGQGAVLEAGVPMTPDWHKPVSSVLDHFGLSEVALIGLSLGGGLVMRAAALESRVKYVVAFDILTNLLGVSLAQAPGLVQCFARLLLRARASFLLNALAGLVAKRSPVVRWGLAQGMRVTGTTSPYAYLQAAAAYDTRDVSAHITQDVLLLAGSEDHYVPMAQLHEQMRTLTRARSVTARIFTRSESAQNHCQVGNYCLVLRAIVSWLDACLGEHGRSPP